MRKILLLMLTALLMTSCTWSFQQIDTHGTATDVMDEQMSTDPTVSPDISVPISAMPSGPSIVDDLVQPPKE